MKSKIQILVHILFGFVIIGILTSCFKDEDEIIPLPERKPGDPKIVTLDKSIYENQIYFDFQRDTIAAWNDILDWDLCFECAPDGWHILLNPSRMMRAVNVGNNWEDVTSTAGIPFDAWKWDSSDGNLDSTAIGAWMNVNEDPPTFTNEVYIIDLGYDADATMLGFKKVQFTSLQDGTYFFRFADLNGENEYDATVDKIPDRNYIAFSFDNGGETRILEPEKENWQILFSAYTGITMLGGTPQPYFVRGVLLNPYQVLAMRDTSYLFSELEYDLAQTFNFTDTMDIIGHEWKYPTGDPMVGITYVCDTSMHFVLKTPDADYFKLRFLDFYSSTGEKGFVTLEYQRL